MPMWVCLDKFSKIRSIDSIGNVRNVYVHCQDKNGFKGMDATGSDVIAFSYPTPTNRQRCRLYCEFLPARHPFVGLYFSIFLIRFSPWWLLCRHVFGTAPSVPDTRTRGECRHGRRPCALSAAAGGVKPAKPSWVLVLKA